MSKSLGNFFTVRDLLDGNWSGGWKVPGEVIRFVFLSTHYRKPMDWTDKKAKEADRTLKKWAGMVNKAPSDGVDVPSAVLNALADDLNTSLAITELHKLAATGDGAGLSAGLKILGFQLDAFSTNAGEDVSAEIDAWAVKLAAARETAMETKDFAAVDALKSALSDAGLDVMMSKDGVSLRPNDRFDRNKLEALT